MDSGVFEPISRNTAKFDDTLLKFYRFKSMDKTDLKPEDFTKHSPHEDQKDNSSSKTDDPENKK